ncbi:MAG: M48 family metalloprotease [Candidatus Omnitrophica bacterium]|nr:M48 family metalloprotease [Candidatus Omnitrophota bacterium]MCM8832195.1 M48 family metalloprotease [Candidatus Omnitrophota bacterium]
MKGLVKVFFIFFIFFGGCVTTEYNVGTRRQDVILYSTQKEVLLGENIAQEIKKKFKISNNPLDIERVNRIGKEIVSVCDRREISYYFYVVEEDDEGKRQKNAFSVPGGYVYIFKDLLDMLNDDELAFVLAHEVGHIVSRHVVKKLQAALGYNLILVASVGVVRNQEFTKGLSFALAQIMAAYSREDEFNADELAVKYLKLLNKDAKAGIDVLEKLYKENKKEIRPISYFRTHPFTAERIRHIKEVLFLPLEASDYIN